MSGNADEAGRDGGLKQKVRMRGRRRRTRHEHPSAEGGVEIAGGILALRRPHGLEDPDRPPGDLTAAGPGAGRIDEDSPSIEEQERLWRFRSLPIKLVNKINRP